MEFIIWIVPFSLVVNMTILAHSVSLEVSQVKVELTMLMLPYSEAKFISYGKLMQYSLLIVQSPSEGQVRLHSELGLPTTGIG